MSFACGRWKEKSPFIFQTMIYIVFYILLSDTYGTCARRWMVGHFTASGILTGRWQFFTVGKHSRNRHGTFHSYQTRNDNTTTNFCYFTWPIRGKKNYFCIIRRIYQIITFSMQTLINIIYLFLFSTMENIIFK